MEYSDIQKRALDLRARAEKTGSVCATHFLTPAEQRELFAVLHKDEVFFTGGAEGCERRMAFFLPEWLDCGDFDAGEYISAVEITAAFGNPGHRDYLGALTGLGIDRRRLGDIFTEEGRAVLFCSPEVRDYIRDNLKKAGRYGVKCAVKDLASVVLPVPKREPVIFTVQSPRLDAVAAGCFRLSRTAAAEKIKEGLVSLNSVQCLRTDEKVSEGDTISVRGMGKACTENFGGRSRKDRIFITAQVYK